MRCVLWVPGKFSLTNKMLDNLRAAGRFSGKRPPRGWVDMFAQETQAIRLAVKAAARGWKASGSLNVWVTVLGHHKHDPDAWLLLGKAAVDGLVDAGVMLSDRVDLHSLGGRVTATAGEDSKFRLDLAPLARLTYGAGFFLDIWPVGDGRCDHV